jgi:hypothetical protein
MKRSGLAASRQMQRWSEQGRTNVQGFCLKICREAWGLPARYPSAIVAWRNTPAKHKFNDWRKAPIGAVHYYEGGRFGHIVIQSEKRMRVWGTDLPVKNKIGLHHRRMPLNRWNYRYLGWSDWLNGHKLPLKGMPK